MRVTARGVTTGPRRPPVGEGARDQGSISAGIDGHRWGQVRTGGHRWGKVGTAEDRWIQVDTGEDRWTEVGTGEDRWTQVGLRDA